MEENNYTPNRTTPTAEAAPVQGTVTEVRNDQTLAQSQGTKFCKHCGGKIPSDAVLCTLCGRQVEELIHSRRSL